MACNPQSATGNEKLLDFCKEMGFRTLTKRVEDNLNTSDEEVFSDKENIYSANISYTALTSEEALSNYLAKVETAASFASIRKQQVLIKFQITLSVSVSVSKSTRLSISLLLTNILKVQQKINSSNS